LAPGTSLVTFGSRVGYQPSCYATEELAIENMVQKPVA
jgi:hypothetical protein